MAEMCQNLSLYMGTTVHVPGRSILPLFFPQVVGFSHKIVSYQELFCMVMLLVQ